MLPTLLVLPFIAQIAILEPVRRIPLGDVLDGADGRPRSIAIAPDGMIALGQRSPVAVVLLDSMGKLIRRIGREGEGPGEFLAPIVAFHHDTLVVGDGALRRVTLFGRHTGAVIRQFSVPTVSELAVDASGLLHVMAMNSAFLRRGAAVSFVRIRLNGTVVDTVTATAVTAPVPPPDPYWHVRRPGGGGYDVPIPYHPRFFYAVAPGGGILAGWSGTPRIDHTTRTGRATIRWRGVPENKAISIEARRAARDSIFQDDARTAPGDLLRAVYKLEDIPSRFPAFSEIDVDAGGRLWLQRPDAPRDSVRFEVISAAGTPLGKATMPATKLGRVRAWSATRLVTVTEDDDGSWIEVYRIK
jgi:hypothetical protein